MRLFGRSEELPKLVNWIAGIEASSHETRVCAISVEGPPGVGKTALVNEALRQVPRVLGNTLVVKTTSMVSGSDVPQWIANQVLSKRSALGSNEGHRRRMRETAKLCGELTRVIHKGHEALASKDERLRTATAAALLELGTVAASAMGAQLVKSMGLVLDDEDLSRLEPALEAMTTEWARHGAGWMSRVFGRRTRPASLSPAVLLAERLAADLRTVATQRKTTWRLVFVLDDYDQQLDVIGHFIVRHLLDRLEQLDVSAAFVFCGTRPLRSTDSHWRRTLARYQRNDAGRRELVLGPLSRLAVAEFARAHEIHPSLHERIGDETGGYPWLIEQAIREIREKARHEIGFLGNFVDRATEGMDDQQIEWLFRLCFVGQVTEESAALVLDPEVDLSSVMTWFRRSTSVCRTNSIHYEVWPYIRYRVLDYLWRSKGETWWSDLAERAGLHYRPGQTTSGTSIVSDLKQLHESGLLDLQRPWPK